MPTYVYCTLITPSSCTLSYNVFNRKRYEADSHHTWHHRTEDHRCIEVLFNTVLNDTFTFPKNCREQCNTKRSCWSNGACPFWLSLHSVNENGRGNFSVDENSYFHFKLFHLVACLQTDNTWRKYLIHNVKYCDIVSCRRKRVESFHKLTFAYYRPKHFHSDVNLNTYHSTHLHTNKAAP